MPCVETTVVQLLEPWKGTKFSIANKQISIYWYGNVVENGVTDSERKMLCKQTHIAFSTLNSAASCGLKSRNLKAPSRLTTSSFTVQHTMSPVLPFDIIELIVDIVGETTISTKTQISSRNLLLSPIPSSSLICRKHLFAGVRLYNGYYLRGSSKKGFIKLLESRPDVVSYIRALMDVVNHNNDDDHLLPPILLNFLPTFSRLNCLAITTCLSYFTGR